MLNPCRVLVANDPGIMRDGLCGMLQSDIGVEVAGAVAGRTQALRHIEESEPGLLVIEIGPYGSTGIATIMEVKRRCAHLLHWRETKPCANGVSGR